MPNILRTQNRRRKNQIFSKRRQNRTHRPNRPSSHGRRPRLPATHRPSLRQYAPVTGDEHTLVQTIADTGWRLLRIAPLEAAILCLGLRELAAEFAKRKTRSLAPLCSAPGSPFITGAISVTSPSGAPPAQSSRKRYRPTPIPPKSRDSISARAKSRSRIKQGRDFNPADCGFDFSIGELHHYLDRTATQFRLTQTRPDFDKFVAAYRLAHKEVKAA